MNSAADIPGEHAQIFWNVDEAKLDLDRDAAFIITRILSQGAIAQTDWLRARYGDRKIRAVLRAPRGARELSVRDVAYWALILGLPKAWAEHQIDEKLASPWGR